VPDLAAAIHDTTNPSHPATTCSRLDKIGITTERQQKRDILVNRWETIRAADRRVDA
jgi:hypothetical protein